MLTKIFFCANSMSCEDHKMKIKGSRNVLEATLNSCTCKCGMTLTAQLSLHKDSGITDRAMVSNCVGTSQRTHFTLWSWTHTVIIRKPYGRMITTLNMYSTKDRSPYPDACVQMQICTIML